jgi:hypothetical protein
MGAPFSHADPGTWTAGAAYQGVKGEPPMFSTLMSLALCVGFFVMMPLVIVGVVAKLLLTLVLLPFKLLGAALNVFLGLVTAAISVVSALGFVALTLVFLVALPLLPLLLFGGFVWAVVKALSPAPVRAF